MNLFPSLYLGKGMKIHKAGFRSDVSLSVKSGISYSKYNDNDGRV